MGDNQATNIPNVPFFKVFFELEMDDRLQQSFLETRISMQEIAALWGDYLFLLAVRGL